MKGILILIIFYSTIATSQNNNLNFFETEQESNGKSYAFSISRAKIDTIVTYKRFSQNRVIADEIETIDTIYFKDFKLLKNIKFYDSISQFADTVHVNLELSEESKFREDGNCSKFKVWIKSVEDNSSLIHDWICNNEKEMLDENSWKYKWMKDEYNDTVNSFVMKIICDPREIIIPAHYLTNAIVVKPKKNISKEELIDLDKYCIDTYHYKRKNIRTFLRKEKSFFAKRYKYEVKDPAKLIKVEVFNKNELKKLKSKILNRLITKKLIANDKNNESENIKIGLMKFQIEKGLPIGQYDKETINLLLE